MSPKLNPSKKFLYFASMQLVFPCANVVRTRELIAETKKDTHNKNYPSHRFYTRENGSPGFPRFRERIVEFSDNVRPLGTWSQIRSLRARDDDNANRIVLSNWYSGSFLIKTHTLAVLQQKRRREMTKSCMFRRIINLSYHNWTLSLDVWLKTFWHFWQPLVGSRD